MSTLAEIKKLFAELEAQCTQHDFGDGQHEWGIRVSPGDSNWNKAERIVHAATGLLPLERIRGRHTASISFTLSGVRRTLTFFNVENKKITMLKAVTIDYKKRLMQ